jgi:hypothetical protein
MSNDFSCNFPAERWKQWCTSPGAIYSIALTAFAATAVYFRSFHSGHFRRTITDLGLPATGIQQIYCSLSKASASEVFWKLGDRFWMQIIDGKYHQWGRMVFDEALHKGKKESGFFASLKDGCNFAAEHLTEAPSIEFYKYLHKKLCSHFKGKETNTVMSAEETGQFRRKACQCRSSIYSKKFTAEAFIHSQNVNLYEVRDQLKEDATGDFTERYQTICNNYPVSKEWLDNWNCLWDKRVKEVDLYIKQICQELGIKKIVKISKVNHLIYVDYLCDNPDEIESIAKLLFERYQRQIKEINTRPQDSQTQKQKVRVIADLYQLLEWLHPFPDGQGRTDLVLMAKHLSEQVSNPAILIEPYSSTFSTLADWTEELLQGMRLWQAEAAKS